MKYRDYYELGTIESDSKNHTCNLLCTVDRFLFVRYQLIPQEVLQLLISIEIIYMYVYIHQYSIIFWGHVRLRSIPSNIIAGGKQKILTHYSSIPCTKTVLLEINISAGTTNPGRTRKPENFLKGIRNSISWNPDNPC